MTDVFLLSVSPAMGVSAGMYIPNIYDGLLSQIAYHIDAMFNAFHCDALSFVLFHIVRDTIDDHGEQVKQYLSIDLCVFIDMLLNFYRAVHATGQKHRKYRHKIDPWTMGLDMNLHRVIKKLSDIAISIQEKDVSSISLRHICENSCCDIPWKVSSF